MKLRDVKLKIKKDAATLTIIGMGMIAGLTGCGNTNKTKTEEPTTISTEATQEATTEVTEVKEETLELNVNENASIEKVVDNYYESSREFFDNYGISKNQIRDMIFVLNDKYTDEDGKLIIDETRVEDAYTNIKIIIGQSDDSIIQKIDNINAIEYADNIENDYEGTLRKSGYTDEEINTLFNKELTIAEARSIADEVSAKNNWKIAIHPSLVPLIDKNVAGGKATIEEVSEWEKERDYQIKLMNDNNKYDRESINNYVINQEIGEYNENTDNMRKVNRNGQKYALACSNFTSLNMAGEMNPFVIYLKGYETIDKNIKINPTDEERFLENDVITLIQQGLIDPNTYQSIVSESKAYISNGYAVNEIEEKIHEKYTLDNDSLRLVVSYAHYLTTMAAQKYIDVECDEDANTKDNLVNIRNNTTSLNDVKKYTLA